MQQKRPRWYEAWFDRDEYAIVYRHRNDEEARKLIDLLERITGVGSGDSIVDIGCGRGRHAIRLARHGYRVTGLDLSERSIDEARERAASDGLEVEFVVGDMRTALCDACYDGAVNLFTAFGYFEIEDEHQKAVNAVADSLKPGGWFVQDFLNPTFVRETLVPEDRRTEDGIEIMQQRTVVDGRIRKKITLTKDGRSHSFQESVRLLELDDFKSMYDRAGLRFVDVFGDYEGGAYGPASPRMIMHSIKSGGE